MGVDIAYIVSHGFAARMVMQTNLLGKIANRGLTVALICPDSSDPNLLEQVEGYDIRLIENKTINKRWNSEYFYFRKYLFENVKQNAALWEKHSYRWHTAGFSGKFRLILYMTLFYLTSLLPFFRIIYKSIEKIYLHSDETIQFLKKLNPSLLVSTYPVNFSESSLLYNAEKAGIKTCIHLLSWDNISCKGAFPALANRYIAWGKIMASELNEYYGISRENIDLCGVPHFDVHVSIKDTKDYVEYIKELGLIGEKKYILIALSAPYFSPNEIEIAEQVSQWVNSNQLYEDIQLIIRPHPQNLEGSLSDPSWLPRLRKLNRGKTVVDFPRMGKSKMMLSMRKNDLNRLSKLISGAEMVINVGSTVSIDALMQDKPVILSSFDGKTDLPYWKSARRLLQFPHLDKLISTGGVSVSTSYEMLKNQIGKYLKDPDRKHEHRKQALLDFCYSNDGHSTKRVVTALENLVKKTISKKEVSV